MKTLLITDEAMNASPNGIGTYTQQLIDCLVGIDVVIKLLLFNSDKKNFEIEEKDGIQYYHFPAFSDGSIQPHSRIIEKIFRLYIADSADNIFLINYSPFSSLMKAIKASHPLSRQIFIIHDMAWTLYFFGDVERYIRILKQKNRKIIRDRYSYVLRWYEEEMKMIMYADRVVCLSEDTYNLLSKYYSVEKEKLCLIPNAINEQILSWSEVRKRTFKEKMLLKDNEKIILFVGRLTEQKGFVIYIEAFKEVIKRYPSCRLVVVGYAKDWNYILSHCSNVSAKILFTGILSAEELGKWYQIADIGVLPSYTEQCSYVGLEMIAYGLPIVASDGFGVRCMFQDGENVKVARIGNRRCTRNFKEELISSTLYMLKCNNESRRSNQFTHTAAKVFYSLERMKGRYLDLFKLS